MSRVPRKDNEGQRQKDNGSGRVTPKMRGILLALAAGKCTPATIGKYAKRDRANVYRTLRRLVEKGLIQQEKETQHYFLTGSGKDEALRASAERTTEKDNENLEGATKDNGKGQRRTTARGHNIRAKFPIVRAPAGWKESPKAFFALQRVDWEPLHLKNVDAVQFSIDDFVVKAMSASVVLILRSPIYDEFSPESMRRFYVMALAAQRELERRFPQLVLGVPLLSTGEMAHERDPVALLREAAGDRFVVIRHTDRKARVQFDKSKGPVEIEFLHPGLFDQDSERWTQRIPQIIESPYDYDVMGVMLEQAEFKNDEQDVAIQSLDEVARVLAAAHMASERTLTVALQGVLRALTPQQPQDAPEPENGRPFYVG